MVLNGLIKNEYPNIYAAPAVKGLRSVKRFLSNSVNNDINIHVCLCQHIIAMAK